MRPVIFTWRIEISTAQLLPVALSILAKKAAAESGTILRPDESVAQTCARLSLPRSSVYAHQKVLAECLQALEEPIRGRPKIEREHDYSHENMSLQFQLKILRFQVANISAVIKTPKGYTSYSSAFKRFILDLYDEWEHGLQSFSEIAEIPYTTLAEWQNEDRNNPIPGENIRRAKDYVISENAGLVAHVIVADFQDWQLSIKDFLRYEATKLGIKPSSIANILRILGILPLKKKRPLNRYRGTTEKLTPGSLLVTDGKELNISFSTRPDEKRNWQGIVDQTTGCHTACVINASESAQGVQSALAQSIDMMGTKPLALLHDNKSIHKEKSLQIYATGICDMIAATLRRPQNKAILEGEFGRFEQFVGQINIDDTDHKTLVTSICHEVIRAYTAGVNHTPSASLNGKSRIQTLKQSCGKSTSADKNFLHNLKLSHERGFAVRPLPTKNATLKLIDKAYNEFDLHEQDPKRSTRNWLASKFEPAAIRQAIAIFANKVSKGNMNHKFSLRYLVKVAESCQEELDLKHEEATLLKYAEEEKRAWLKELDQQHQEITKKECVKEQLFEMSELAASGHIIIDSMYWEKKLTEHLLQHPDLHRPVINHIRRLYECPVNARRLLISKLTMQEVAISPIDSS